MSNAADGYLGDWLPHKDSCRCSDCELWRSQQRIARLDQENRQLRERVEQYAEDRVLKIEKHSKELKALRQQVARLSAPVSDEQVQHMVNRFLGWALPETLNPDGGISFKRISEKYPMPTGTNFLDANQAEQMVLYIIDGLPARAKGDHAKEDKL